MHLILFWLFVTFKLPGLSKDLWKDNVRQKYIMKRPYSTNLSYEKILAGV